VKLKFETAPTMLKLFAAGEMADIVVAPPATMDEIVKMGKAVTDGRLFSVASAQASWCAPGTPLPTLDRRGAHAPVLEVDGVRLQPRLERALHRTHAGKTRPLPSRSREKRGSFTTRRKRSPTCSARRTVKSASRPYRDRPLAR